ncbi:RASGEF1B isoform 13 [Pan troglodytes]|uniref:RasGEF domain family member 1B n=3 Tax=Pan TaxID=9596 RepID=A0A2I3RUZ9_PANTR|nr:RASGEF1B isoform 13 [Pan troglodytes]
MAKFLAELLGCTLPSKGASPMFESKSHSRVGLKSSTKQKFMYSSSCSFLRSHGRPPFSAHWPVRSPYLTAKRGCVLCHVG